MRMRALLHVVPHGGRLAVTHVSVEATPKRAQKVLANWAGMKDNSLQGWLDTGWTFVPGLTYYTTENATTVVGLEREVEDE